MSASLASPASPASPAPSPTATVPGAGTGKFILQLGEEDYRIVAPDGTEGDVFEYGDPAILPYKGQLYMAFAPNDEDEHEDLETHVWLLIKQATDVEEVSFAEPVGEDDDAEVAIDETEEAPGEAEGDDDDQGDGDDQDDDDRDDDDGRDSEEGR
jgi:hypothetical protein